MPGNDLITHRNVRLEIVYQAEGADAPKSIYYRFFPLTSIRIGVSLKLFEHGANTDHVDPTQTRRRRIFGPLMSPSAGPTET